MSELSKKYNHSREWIQDKIHSFIPKIKKRDPREITAVIDATFFGKREDKFGLIVAKEIEHKEPIAYNFVELETKEVYQDLIYQINSKGFKLKAVTLDGKPGIFKLFRDMPIQMCHFHMQSIITRKITKKPKLQASKDLKRVVYYLGRVSECRFKYLLDSWYKRYKDFINEKSEDNSKRGWHYTHKNIRSAYNSLNRFLPYLFTYKKYPDLKIPNTTNHLDGGCFSPLKSKLNIHRGISKKMKRKMIIYFLENRVK